MPAFGPAPGAPLPAAQKIFRAAADNTLACRPGARPTGMHMDPAADPKSWLTTLQDLLHYYVPPLEPSAPFVVGCLAAIAAGLFLVFRSARSERMVVCCFAFLLGGWIGWKASELIGTPGPISMAVVGVILTVISYRTYRIWLAGGSVVVLFLAAVVFQLGRGDLTRYLPTLDQANERIKGGMITGLPGPDEQMRSLHEQAAVQYEKFKEKVSIELKALGPVGWIIPFAAALIGAALAFWALRVFSVVWMGLFGALMAVFGAEALLCAQWPDLRPRLFREPFVSMGIIAGLWLVGLVLQAKEARLPKRNIKSAPGDNKTNPQPA